MWATQKIATSMWRPTMLGRQLLKPMIRIPSCSRALSSATAPTTSQQMNLNKRLSLSEEVRQAMFGAPDQRKPVVALESTIIAHGMPFPQNLEMATHVENILRSHGVCPATVCIADGKLKVGLSAEDLKRLAEEGPRVRKCSTRDIPAALAEKIMGATTVSSTMRIAHAAGIKVFVTGGLGGVHRFCEETLDISTDLIEMSRTPVAVVCAGVKSILDIPKTLEHFETHAVPVIGYQCDNFPAFFTQDSGVPAHLRKDTPEEVAAMIHESREFGLPSGFVVAVPNPKPVAQEVIDNAIKCGLEEAAANHITGNKITPYLLKRLNEMTGGVSLSSNITLVNNNAVVGSQIAMALFEMEQGLQSKPANPPGMKTKSPKDKVLVVGGLVLDVIGTATNPSGEIIRGTSNIGEIHQACGGVARNIAECLHRIGADPLLISQVGNDVFGSVLLDHLKKTGMRTEGIQVSNDVSTSIYSAVLSPIGELDAAIADMRALESINVGAIDDEILEQARYVVCDGNMVPSKLLQLAERCAEHHVEVWFEPTSVTKSMRLVEAGALSKVTFISPNGDELRAMTDAVKEQHGSLAVKTCFDNSFPVSPSPELEEADRLPEEEMRQVRDDLITVLLEMASEKQNTSEKHVVLTMGRHGVVLGSINVKESSVKSKLEQTRTAYDLWGVRGIEGHEISIVHLPGVQMEVMNCTGAGDSLVGGTVYGLLKQDNIFTSCHMGMIAARKSLVSPHAISPFLSSEDFKQLCSVREST